MCSAVMYIFFILYSVVIDDISIQPIGAFFKKKRNIYCKTAIIVVKFFCYMPVCWNWQTRRIQNPLVAIPCGFDPRHRHHKAKPLPEGEGLSVYESNGTGVEPIRRPRHRSHKARQLRFLQAVRCLRIRSVIRYRYAAALRRTKKRRISELFRL